MAKSALGQTGLKDFSGASRSDLEALVTNLVEKGRVSAEVINSELDDIRKVTSNGVKSISESKKELSLEQQGALLDTLRTRFERNHELHDKVNWTDVENALKSNPKALWSLGRMDATGGEPDVIGEEKDVFVFGDCSVENPSGRRDMAFDKDAAKYFKKLNMQFNGIAEDWAKEAEVDFMSKTQYLELQNKLPMDFLSLANPGCWLQSPPRMRGDAVALRGHRTGLVDVYQCSVHALGSLRTALRVPKVIKQITKELSPEEAETAWLGELRTRFDALSQLHEGIQWEDVEKFLRADVEAMSKLRALDEKGHQMNLFGEENGEFVFISGWANSSEVAADHRNITFDPEGQKEAEEKGSKPNGNALSIIAGIMGVKEDEAEKYLADPEFHEQLLKVRSVNGWAWLKTDAHIRGYGQALNGGCDGFNRNILHSHDDGTSFRAELRIPCKLSPEQAETAWLGELRTRFDALSELHISVQWADVEKSLRANIDAMRKLRTLDEKGHKINVFGEENGELVFASAWDNSSEVSAGHRNITYGNAMSIVAGIMGVKEDEADKYLADPSLHEQLIKAVEVNGWAWLKGVVPFEGPDGNKVSISGGRDFSTMVQNAGNHDDRGSFRAELRVPKEKPAQ
jgi:hypothetical protein